jgi:hypothetical protein
MMAIASSAVRLVPPVCETPFATISRSQVAFASIALQNAAASTGTLKWIRDPAVNVFNEIGRSVSLVENQGSSIFG